MTALPRLPLALVACATVACGGQQRQEVRYENRPPVWQVDDRVPAGKPAETDIGLTRYYLEYDVLEPIARRLQSGPRPRARNVNSLGEVPDSTWFTNRIGVRELTPDELRRGPNTGPPDRSRPWTVLGTKLSGAALGIRIEDARGDGYLLKFDSERVPEAETGADVVAQRLLWAFGYNVPENQIVSFPRDQLVVGEDAEVKLNDQARPMTEDDLDALLARAYRRPDGQWRALASKLLPGEPLGGFMPEGTRKDDPNDVVPHQLRRDLRGQYVVFSWLDHTDVKPHNTLDMWRAIDAQGERGYVVHYILDFGKALGVFSESDDSPRIGYAYTFDYPTMLKSLASFGLWKRPWERAGPYPTIRGVGKLGSDQFDPGNWYTNYRWLPFQLADRYDKFWAAKILMRFSPELIRAAVEQGEYSDPRAVDRLTEVLVDRQRKIGRYWFSRVTPLDDFAVHDNGAPRLCATDLWVRHRFGSHRITRMATRSRTRDGTPIGPVHGQPVDREGRACVRIHPAPGDDAYTLVELRTFHGDDDDLPPIHIHLARDPKTNTLRIIGIWRR